MIATEQLGRGRDAGRSEAKEEAMTLFPFFAAQALRDDGLLLADAQMEIGLSPWTVSRQTHQRFHQNGLGIPRNGLVVQGQAGFFITVMQGLRLGASPVDRPEVMHGPVAPALDPRPHRVPPTRSSPVPVAV